jgi:hypothetical protein
MVAPWWVQPAVTFVGILVAATMVRWQQRATARANMKLKLFETLRASFDTASDSCVHATTSVRFIVDATYALCRSPLDSSALQRLKNTVDTFIDANGKVGRSAADLLIVLEQHDIVSEHFLIFRKVIRYTTWDVQRGFDLCFGEMTQLPSDPEKLREAATYYCDETRRLADFISDIQIETQNLLVSRLFREGFRWRVADRRKPADSRHIVIRTDLPDVVATLSRHFEAHPAAQYFAALSREAAARADAGMPPHPAIPPRRRL